MISLFGQLIVDGIAMGLIYVILAAGFVLIMSVSGIFFIAYGQFYMIGAYIVWIAITFLKLPFLVSLILAIIATTILGLISYRLVFKYVQFAKRQLLAVIVAALGLSMILSQLGLLVFGTLPRSIPPIFPGIINFAGINIPIDKLVLIILALVVTIALFWCYEKTNLGRAMRSVAYSPVAASLQGIKSIRIYYIVMGVGCALASFAGGIMGPSYSIHPEMGTNIILSVLLIAMLGGMDSLLGTIPAGLIIGLTLSFGQYFIGGQVQILLYIVIGIIVFFRPGGLLGRGKKFAV